MITIVTPVRWSIGNNGNFAVEDNLVRLSKALYNRKKLDPRNHEQTNLHPKWAKSEPVG